MARDQTRIEQEERPDDAEDQGPSPQYVVDIGGAEASGRSLVLLVGTRRCYSCIQADDEQTSAVSKVRPNIKRIATHCAQTSDYLLQDTPLKEAIFRVLLGGGNRPMTAEDISQVLSEKWAMTAYPRDVSSRVIQRLLDSSGAYCITAVP